MAVMFSKKKKKERKKDIGCLDIIMIMYIKVRYI